MKKMFILPFLSCYWVVTLAQVRVSLHETGFSDQYKSANNLGEYTFGYNEDHTTGGSFRRETSDRLGNKLGSYGLRIGDGRIRIVNYVADHNGFRADVYSNEPGVQSQNSNQFSKIYKDKMYSIFVPGFKYVPASPHVTIENNKGTNRLGNKQVDEVNDGFREEDRNMDGESFANVYAGEGNREGDFDSVFPHEDFHGEYSQRQLDPSHLRMIQEQEFDDQFLSDEYSQESESAVQNRSAQLDETAIDSSTEIQKEETDSAPTSDSLQQKDATRNEKISYKNNKYNTESASSFGDLHPFQSTIIISKESVTSHDNKNVTVLEGDSHKNVTSNVKPEMPTSI